MARPPHIRPALWLGLYGALLLCVILSYFLKYPLPEFPEKILAIFSALFLVLSSACLGQRILAILNRKGSLELSGQPVNPMLLFIVAASVGLATFGWAVFLLGWAVPGSLKIKLSLLTMASLLLLIRNGRSLFHDLRLLYQPTSRFSTVEVVFLLLAAAGMAGSLVACFSPVTYYDSLVYHLALPALYSRTDAITAVPSNLYSFFPANVEMLFLYLINQLPEAEYAVNLTGWFFSFLISLGLFQWGKESGNRKQGLLAMALWWTMPAVLLLSIGAYIDVPLALMIFLSVRCFVLSMQSQWNGRWLILSALFSGFACATKYTGAVCPILLAAFLLGSVVMGKGPRVKAILMFMGFTVLPFAPWLLKNFVQVGNPLFPFFYQWLGGHAGWNNENAARYFQLLTEYGAKSNILYELFLAPWRVSTSGTEFGGGFDVLGDFGWPLFIFGVPPVLFIARREKSNLFLLGFLIGHFAAWFLGKPVLRFLMGALPMAVLLTSRVFIHFMDQGSRILKAAPLFFALPFLLSNFFIYFLVTGELQLFSVALGHETRVDHLRRRLAFYPMYEFINGTFRPTDKVLLLGEQRTYRLAVPFAGSNLFAISSIAQACNDGSMTPEKLLKDLRSQGVNHVLINTKEMERLGGLASFGFTPAGERLWKAFLTQKTRVLAHKNGLALHAIL